MLLQCRFTACEKPFYGFDALTYIFLAYNLCQVTRSSDASYKVVQCDSSLLIHSCYHINTHEAASLPLETGDRCLLSVRSK